MAAISSTLWSSSRGAIVVRVGPDLDRQPGRPQAEGLELGLHGLAERLARLPARVAHDRGRLADLSPGVGDRGLEREQVGIVPLDRREAALGLRSAIGQLV